jgi:hypothetical protein
LFECPHCGADVAVGAKVCRECGSDADTGWQPAEEVDYQSTELPQGYGAGDESTVSGRRRPWVAVVALLLALAMICWLVFAR